MELSSNAKLQAPAPQAIPPPNQQGPFPPYGPPEAGYQQVSAG